MQHYESASFQMLRHQYDTPTFETNALRLDSNEGRLKRLLLQRQIQPYLKSCLAVTGDAYRPTRHTHF